LYKPGIEPTPEDQGEGGAPLGQMPSVRQIKLRLELTSKASKKIIIIIIIIKEA
jgi:hypothetical protein